MNLEIPKPNQIRSGTKSLRYLGPKICNFGIPYKIFRKSEQIGMDKFAHGRYAKSGIMHFLRLFATLKLRTNHYFHSSLRSWLLTSVGYILHLSFCIGIAYAETICLCAIWLVFTSVVGYWRCGVEWDVCSKLVNKPQSITYVYTFWFLHYLYN